jgi:hypothetical protein
MVQETGETRDAIIEADNKIIEDIINTNKDRTDPYWIVVFAKPAKVSVEGKPTLMKHIKPYFTKPSSQVGCIIGEVNNQTGNVQWEVNMPQKPFDFEALQSVGAKACNEVVVETTTIPNAYVTQ